MSINKVIEKIVNALKIVAKFIVDVVKLYLKNDLPIFAASTSFFLIIASIPLFMIMVSTLSLLPIVDVEEFTENLNLLFPNVPYITNVVSYLWNVANQLSESTVIYINILTSLIAGSTCLIAFLIGIRKVHGIKHTSNYILIKFMTIINILILYSTIIFTMVFFVVGRLIIEYSNQYIPIVSVIFNKVMEYKYLAVIVTLMVLSLSLYLCCSNFQRKYLKNIYGAVFVTFSWLIVSNLFSIYFTRAGMGVGVYQSITGTLLILIWLFVCMNLVFIGACINEVVYPQSRIEEERAMQKTHIDSDKA